MMRERFAVQLAGLTDELVQMCQTVGRTIEAATDGVLHLDSARLDAVMAECDAIEVRHQEVEQRVVLILARQSPVGRDLRSVVASMHIAADVGRMAGLTRHICEIGWRRAQPCARPLTAAGLIDAIGAQAHRLAEAAVQVMIDADADGARHLDDADQTMDKLCHELLGDVEQHADGDVALAVDLALLCRFYVRYADHAVAVGRRVHFASTGQVAV